MRMYGPVRVKRDKAGVRVVAGPSRLAIFTVCAVVIGLGIAFYFALDAARVNKTGDPTGEYVLSGLLAIAAFGAILMAIARFRRRIALSAWNEQLIAETRSLLTRRVAWRISPDDFLIFATQVSHQSTDQGSKVTRSYRLHAANDEPQRTELLRSPDGETVRSLGRVLAKELGDWSMEVVEYSDTESELLRLDRLQVDRLRRKRDVALQKMKSQANELETRQQQLEAEATIGAAENEADEETRKQLELAKKVSQVAQSEVRQAEFETRAQDFQNYEFIHALPGEVVEFTQLNLPAELSIFRVLSRPGTMGVSILLFILTPILAALFGMLLVAIVDQIPSSEMTLKLRQTFVDMFAFGASSFLWTPVLIGLYGAWTLLKLDAAFSTFRVRFDWGAQKLTVDQGRAGTRTISMKQIRTLATSTVHTKQLQETKWKHFVRLCVETDQPGTVSLIEDSVTNSDPDPESAADCLEPFASDLAQSLNVPIKKLGDMLQKYDPSGFPYRPNILDGLRIWSLASTKSRRSVIVTFFAAVLVFLTIFLVHFLGQ